MTADGVPFPADDAQNLALSVIDASASPLLLLDGGLTVLAASRSFGEAFGIEPRAAAGRPLGALNGGEWASPRLDSLLRATASGAAEIDAYEMDLPRAGAPARRLVVNARKLDYGREEIRLLLSVADVTEARARDKQKDDLLREKAILLQELQHRVANSLQIIASVLMQSARKVQSKETRAHLYDAHQRVMSIATLQQQLAVTQLGDVVLRDYFKSLCRSLDASLISDHKQLTLDVTADDSLATPDVSISLGLIVTELVINALKHAFPHHRHGRIAVDYSSTGSGWTLSVEDNGVGMPNPEETTPGLGTSIVQALAAKLGAVVTVTGANPGTRVEIAHAA